ncbi:LacI family DNA-binding transcriptional regulator [Aquabacter spiritensis]|uniref:LacI family transcriptional regulator n=1 Tax=Aquabacter spiritensis TaxID=933073 RepID=A0A4R3M0F8_9HYPH|nr:LacI family DNA-binding transcriptional regulator [Aquabacter spiritensis]TCT06066.1 LacI family transcriptional regulator [Aquabacter spiritensis]
MATTLGSIARLVGVDASLVSRVLRGDSKARISDAKRAQILKIAADSDYRPNRIGRSLRTGRAHILGMLTPDITNPFHSVMFRGVEEVAMAGGYDTVLCNTDDNPERCRKLVSVLAEGHIDGLLVGTARAQDESIAWLRSAGLPYLLVNRRTADALDPWVGPDDFAVGQIGCAHLAGLGHRRIAFLISDLAVWNHRRRLDGFLAGLASAGLDPAAALIATDLDTRAAAKAFVAELLRRPAATRPTAVFAPQTMVSQGAVAALFEAGLRVPHDLSIVGFSALADPDITAICPPNLEMGRAAATHLLARLAGPLEAAQAPLAVTLPVRLVERGSTGPAPAGPGF